MDDAVMTTGATDTSGTEITARGAWSQVHNGGMFYPHDPRVEDIWIEDIAAHLSCICRYGGAVGPRNFYTVAQHSVICSYWAEDEFGWDRAREALLHDAAEAYVGDMVRPMKVTNDQYIKAETSVHAVIASKFDIPAVMTNEMRLVDNIVTSCEKRDLLPMSPPWPNMPEADPDLIINPLGPMAAYRSFANRFAVLFPEVDAIFDED